MLQCGKIEGKHLPLGMNEATRTRERSRSQVFERKPNMLTAGRMPAL